MRKKAKPPVVDECPKCIVTLRRVRKSDLLYCPDCGRPYKPSLWDVARVEASQRVAWRTRTEA